jgi:hypothetical protein
MDIVTGFTIVFSIVNKVLIIFLYTNELIRLKHVFILLWKYVLCYTMYKINKKSGIMPLHATKPLNKKKTIFVWVK